MDKIKFALKLANECTYADEMTEGAKIHLRNAISEALAQLQDKPTPVEMGNRVSAWWKVFSTRKCQKKGCHKLAVCEGFCGAHCNCKA